MALGRTYAVALIGLEGQLVEVECDISTGLPGLSFTGLADVAVVESRDRLRAAIANSDAEWPNKKITVALLPADLRKIGSRFDLAVGVAVLAAAGQLPPEAVACAGWIAELGLDGRLRPVRGVLPSVLAARRLGLSRVVVSPANGAEAALVDGIDVRVAGHLAEIVAALTGAGPPLPNAAAGLDEAIGVPHPDLADVAGQFSAKRALEIAAAGGHHLFLLGTPGAGKTMLAERLPGLLPPLSDEAALEVTAIHSVAGLLTDQARLVRQAPLQAPHHTATVPALVGGGAHLARPGAISLAHHGVLFMDEAAEFPPRALDALRQPLESGQVVLQRSGGSVTYPARFQLVLATNPCGCGLRPNDCTCTPPVKRRYLQRLSGPLMDRIDLRVYVEPVPHADLFAAGELRETTAAVAARVAQARGAAAERWAPRWQVNAGVPGSELRSPRWLPRHTALRAAAHTLERGMLSARGFDRVLRLSWTLADLSGRTTPAAEDVAEALFYRTGQSESWAA